MKAFVFADAGRIDVADVPQPRLDRPDQVLLRPLCVGICFTDKHAYDGWLHPAFRKGEVFGHEGSAIVAETGTEVTGLARGDRVAVLPISGCGSCPVCAAGFATRCRQAGRWVPQMEAEFLVAPARACFRLPESVTDVAGACIESLTCGVRAVRNSGIAYADNVVVLGGDDYALAAAQAARAAGAARVVVADPLPVRRAVAERLGAVALDPAAPGFAAAVAGLMPFGVDQVFLSQENYLPDSAEYFRQACELLRLQGTVNVLRAHGEHGLGHVPGFLPWSKEITVRHHGVFFGEEPARGGRDRGDFQVTIDAVANGSLDGEAHVSRIVPFDDVRTAADLDEVYAALPASESKVLFRIGSV